MQQFTTITRQGQLTIPKAILREFGVHGATKAAIRRSGQRIIVEPKRAFWSLAGSLRSRIALSDKKLRSARRAFAKEWPRRISRV
ncbi:MAG: AbrB/MazE/SpoVT family DNA-binding domain-containing protein [Patescibacteria group bacterium]